MGNLAVFVVAPILVLASGMNDRAGDAFLLILILGWTIRGLVRLARR